MISGINGISQSDQTDQSAKKTEQALGRDDFLKLFLAQLNYQDPLNPMDSTQFSSQLAQFSSLEQLFNVNNNLESLKTLQDNSSQFQALDMIGKDIEAEGNIMYLKSGATSSGSFSIDGSADCTVHITDSEGYPVREIPLGTLQQGKHSFDWDGRDMNGNLVDSGSYSFEITAQTQSGEVIPVETRIKGQVDRVSLEGDEPILYVGEVPVSLSQVLDVNLPDTGTEG
jgi:flagellar basal-body rod modification protein FlgD